MDSRYNNESYYDTFHTSVSQSELEAPRIRLISGEVEYRFFWESSFFSTSTPLTQSIFNKFSSAVKYCIYDMAKRANLKHSKFCVKKKKIKKKLGY